MEKIIVILLLFIAFALIVSIVNPDLSLIPDPNALSKSLSESFSKLNR